MLTYYVQAAFITTFESHGRLDGFIVDIREIFIDEDAEGPRD